MVQMRRSMGKINLDLPPDNAVIEAAGRVALRHAHLELLLRMVVKTLSGLSISEALDATHKAKAWEVRKNIQQLFASKTKDPAQLMKMKAVLGRCERLSDKRNDLLHSAFAVAPDGTVVVQDEDHKWSHPAPTADELNSFAQEIYEQVESLNRDRLRGFIHEVCEDAKMDR